MLSVSVAGAGFGSGGWFSLCCLLHATEQLEYGAGFGQRTGSEGRGQRGWRGHDVTYYGSAQRGHLYLPGCVPHTPQSLGSGRFGGGDGSASDPGSATGPSADGAVGSGETAPSLAGCCASSGLSLLAAGMAPLVLLLLFCPRLISPLGSSLLLVLCAVWQLSLFSARNDASWICVTRDRCQSDERSLVSAGPEAQLAATGVLESDWRPAGD
jgi:hypothetical protein